MRERKRTPDRSKRLRKVDDEPRVDDPPVPQHPRGTPPPLQPLATKSTPPIGVPIGIPITMGSVDSMDWLRARGITPGNHHWFVEVILGTDATPVAQLWNDELETRLHVYIYPAEWGFLFCHLGRASWIRIADRAHVHGRDDFGLIGDIPPLREMANLARRLERVHTLAFRREQVLVRTNLSDIDESVRRWVSGL